MKNRNQNMIVFVVIIVGVTLFTLMGGKTGTYLDFGEEAVTVSVSDFEREIAYADIAGLELTDLPDPGTMVTGGDKRTIRYGIWENDTWGSYTLFATPKISKGIVLTMNDGSVLVLNYQDEETTGSLHQLFTDLLHSKGYLKETN